ncbi:hypothetical protein V3C99_015599 [Haemonchus contortus]
MRMMIYLNYITTALEIFSAALLASEIILVPLFCKKSRSFSFFKCFVFNGCFGLFSWAVSFQLHRFIGNDSLAYLNLNIFLSGFTFHGYLLTSMLLTFNRFSCIAFPLSFDALWTNRRCFIYFASITLVTFVSVCYRVGAPIEVVWVEEYQSYRWIGYPRVIHAISLAITLTICFTVCFGSLILNIWTFVRWRKHRQTVSPSIYHTQRNQFLFSMTCFVFSAIICLQQLVANVVMFSGNQALANVLFDMYFPLSAFAILIEPYALLVFCGGLRRELFSLFKKTAVEEVHSTSASKCGVWGNRFQQN